MYVNKNQTYNIVRKITGDKKKEKFSFQLIHFKLELVLHDPWACPTSPAA